MWVALDILGGLDGLGWVHDGYGDDDIVSYRGQKKEKGKSSDIESALRG